MTVQPAPSVEDLRLGAMIVATGPIPSPLPLEHTDVVAQVSGPLASVSVTQRFGNPFREPVELAYLFPLPHTAAIVDFELKIGARVIRADMQELEAARQSYAEALAQGKRAGLLEQRRPNLFSLQIANVQPGETILATMRYQERLRYDDGDYEFVFPMGITPKFHANPAEAQNVDAPVAAAGEPIGTVDLSLAVDAGGPAGDPQSPSHQIELTRLDDRRFSVRLLGHVIPNKDFVLRYPVAGEHVQAMAWSAEADGGAAVLVTALPPRLTGDVEPAPREFIFVIDRSGSMSGGPLLQARNALRACLRAMGDKDTFNIQAFDDKIVWYEQASQPVTQPSVEKADQWLGTVEARGGTDILGALDAALKLRPDSERQRYIVFLTDGAVSAEDEALRRIERQIAGARLFTFGIGPSVNRALLARMADLGHGTAEFLQLSEDIEGAIVRFQDRVAYPVVQDLQIAWEGVRAWDVYPARLPDLYIGQPLELVARTAPAGEGPRRLTITGRRGNEPVTLAVDLPAPAAPDPAVMRAWTRARVDTLLDVLRGDPAKTGTVRPEIIGLAIQQRLLTPYTAFVAIDSEVIDREQAGGPRRIDVAVPLPEGLDYAGFFGEPPRGMPAPPSPAAFALGAGPSATAVYRRVRATGSGTASTEASKSMPLSAYLAEEREAGGRKKKDEAKPEDTLRRLAREQNISGSWGHGAEEVEITAAALLAFVRAGHTTKAGTYRRQLAKALKWLTAASASGFTAQARAAALAEMAAATGDAKLGEIARKAQAGLPAVAAPPAGTLTTLDALRAAALLRQPAPVAPELLRGGDAEVAQVWRAVMGV